MSFDKTKAIRNAERYLSQGKLRAAIGEYKQIVENDSKDIGTLNMLGDLYAKNSEKNEAVQCFIQVAEHYGNQGFAQKAIAVYNKISRLQPDSLEVSAKLAELYQSKDISQRPASIIQCSPNNIRIKAGKSRRLPFGNRSRSSTPPIPRSILK